MHLIRYLLSDYFISIIRHHTMSGFKKIHLFFYYYYLTILLRENVHKRYFLRANDTRTVWDSLCNLFSNSILWKIMN